MLCLVWCTSLSHICSLLPFPIMSTCFLDSKSIHVHTQSQKVSIHTGTDFSSLNEVQNIICAHMYSSYIFCYMILFAVSYKTFKLKTPEIQFSIVVSSSGRFFFFFFSFSFTEELIC